MSSCPTNDFFQLWHWLTIFGTLVYYHERMCCVYSWSKYDVDLYLKMKFMWFLWLCVRATVFVIWHSHTIFGTWVYRPSGNVSRTFTTYDLWSQYHNYIFIMNLCLGKIVYALWYRHTRFGFITMRQHVYVCGLCMT